MQRKSINLNTVISVIVLSVGLPPAVSAQQSSTLTGGSPAMNYSRELLKRKDVQNELRLDAHQRDALAKLLNKRRARLPLAQFEICRPLNTRTFQHFPLKNEDNGKPKSGVSCLTSV